MLQNPKKQIILIFLSTCLAGFSLGSIIAFTDPYTTGSITRIFFYISLFLVILGLSTILGLLLRQWLWKGVYVINLQNSFRQAFLVAILLCVSLLLQSLGLLFWWVEVTLILFFVFLEGFLNLKV